MAARQRDGQPVVPFGFGEANLPIVASIIDAFAAAAPDGSYPPVAGRPELLHAAAGYFTRRGQNTQPGQQLSTPGSKAALYLTLATIGGPIIMPSPSWVTYAAQAALLRQPCFPLPIVPGNGGAPDPEQLERTLTMLPPSTTPPAIILTLPDNPTGTLPKLRQSAPTFRWEVNGARHMFRVTPHRYHFQRRIE